MMMGKLIYFILLSYLLIGNVLLKGTHSNRNKYIKANIDLVVYKNSGKVSIAKNHDRIYKGEKFQIVIRTSKDTKLLLLNSSESDCKILQNCFINEGISYYFPGKYDFYTFDSANENENIFVVIYDELDQFLKLLINPTLECRTKTEKLNYYYEENLVIKRKTVPPIVQLSGNLRTTDYSEELTGERIIIKKYKFNVQD